MMLDHETIRPTLLAIILDPLLVMPMATMDPGVLL